MKKMKINPTTRKLLDVADRAFRKSQVFGRGGRPKIPPKLDTPRINIVKTMAANINRRGSHDSSLL